MHEFADLPAVHKRIEADEYINAVHVCKYTYTWLYIYA